jgi:hypothetical protein
VFRSGSPLGVCDLPRGEVAVTDPSHLAGADQIIERAQRLLDRRLLIGNVDLVEVDVVGSKAPQAAFDGASRGWPNLVARMKLVRRPASRRPSWFSEAPGPSFEPWPYMSATSMKLTPRSTAWSRTALAASSLSRPAKLFVPSPTAETSRPESPSRLYST